MVALQDSEVGLGHPVVSILQGYFDPVDPLDYVGYLASRQVDQETLASHVFQLYGAGDTYTPPDSIEVLVHAMRIPYVGAAEFGVGDATPIDVPVSANTTTGGQPYTAVGRQYTPGDYDGHFVAFRHVEAIDDWGEFISSAIAAEDGVPTITG